MIKWWSTTFLSFLFIAFTAMADSSYRRLVNFEWEPIEGATSYDIEITQVSGALNEKDNKFNFKLKTAEWNGKLTPGKYKMILRARDYRGVPGDWSEPSEFFVGLDPVKINTPTHQSKITAKDNKEQSVSFAWQPVGGASDYQITVLDSQDREIFKERTSKTTFKYDLEVAKSYQFKVSAIATNGIESDGVSIAQFELWGPKLDAPEIQKPDSAFVRELSWKNQDFTSLNEVALFKLNPENKKWEKIQSVPDHTSTQLPFPSEWAGGKYQIWVRAKSPLRANSEFSKMSFDVINGNRSPAAEYTALVRKSIERMSGWYGIASYLVTQIQYKGVNPENASSVAYQALGGTGRIGAGWYLPESPWGFLGIIDMSGFTINNKTNTFASAEGNAVYKMSMGDRGEMRFQFGGYYKELPETIGDPFTSTSYSTKIKTIGPHIGGEYWYSLSPKFGIQANAHGYLSLIKVDTPNGQPIETTFSTQFGIMGSYRFSERLTGLVGYARREDKMSYKAKVDSNNFAVDGDINTATVVGDYLNFFAEYNF